MHRVTHLTMLSGTKVIQRRCRIGGMSQTGEDRNTGRKTCSSVTLSTKIPHETECDRTISLHRSNTFRISNQRAQQDTELGPRLLSANRTTVSRTQTSNLFSPLLNISITQTPCSIFTLKQATYSQSKGRC